MEMVRVLIRGDVTNKAFFVYFVFFLLVNYVSIYTTIYFPVTYAFSSGALANMLLMGISSLIYFAVPVIIAWKKISVRDYVLYFVSIDMPLMMLTFFAMIMFVLMFIALAISGVIPPPPMVGEQPPPMSLLSFSFVAIFTMCIVVVKVYLMKKLIDLRNK